MYRYRNDGQRIFEAIVNSNDYARQYYFEKTKLLTGSVEERLINYNYISYKGTDILKRQIFFVYLDKIDFGYLDEKDLIDPFIIYLTKCKRNNIIFRY